jgi:outer membrane protein TolC
MFRLISLLSFIAVAGLAQAQGLTFSSALELATKSSPDIAAQTASVEAARSASLSAGRLPDPKLAFGIDNLPVTGPEQGSLTRDFMTMRKIGLMQDIPNGAKRASLTAIAEAELARAQAENRVTMLSVRRDAAVAWLTRYYLERRAALIDELAQENRIFAQMTEAQFAAGRGMPADVVAPKQEAAEIEDRRDELSAEIAKAKAGLKRSVGTTGDDPLAGDPPVLAIDTQRLRGHVHEHPDLAVFIPMAQAAQAEIHEAEATKRPDWGVELSYGRRGAQFSDMVSLQFTLDLPVFTGTRQDPRIAAKRQDLARVEDQRESMLRDHTQELEAEVADYDVMTRQLTRLDELHLPLAAQKVDLQLASYRGGKAEVSAVLSARRESIDVRLKRIELEGRRAITAAKLFYFYGPGANDSASGSQAQVTP